MEKVRKKRRERLPFEATIKIIIQDNERLIKETYKEFSIEELKILIEKKFIKWRKDFEGVEYEIIYILPYPKCFSIIIDDGVNEILTNIDAQNEDEARELINVKYPNKNILSIKQTLQIIDW